MSNKVEKTNNIYEQLFQDKIINQTVYAAACDAEAAVQPLLDTLSQHRDQMQWKVMRAFQEAEISEYHLASTTGYGYGDIGREKLDALFAKVLGAPSALVREQLVSGTHAIATGLFGLLRPGDELLSATGKPYDTLLEVIGFPNSASGSLSELGVSYSETPLTEEGKISIDNLCAKINDRTRVVFFQRSRGYALRPAIDMLQLQNAMKTVKEIRSDIICFVDNCYGELVEKFEPTEVGADVVAGSLIKNLGGGLAPTGGYLAGDADMIERIAARLTAPGIGSKVGSSPLGRRLYFQGLFHAPGLVYEALAGGIFAAKMFEKLGFEVYPRFDEPRYDLIQAIKLGNSERIIAFCQGLQKASPIDSHVSPEPWHMPGYDNKVIMAGGTFIQGATSELSADAPMREPYAVYFQGGLGQTYVKLGVLFAAQEMASRGLLPDA